MAYQALTSCKPSPHKSLCGACQARPAKQGMINDTGTIGLLTPIPDGCGEVVALYSTALGSLHNSLKTALE